MLLGWRYRDSAKRWLQQRAPGGITGVEKAETLLRRMSGLAVVVEPGAIVCCLAGVARMQPLIFAVLNISGTAARLVALRAIGEYFPDQVDALLGRVEQHRTTLLLVACTIAAAGLLPMLPRCPPPPWLGQPPPRDSR